MALDETVKRLRALLEKATPGPWRSGSVELDAVFVRHDEGLAGPGGERVLLRANKHFEHTADVKLIAEARNALPDLLAAADLLCRLERRIAENQNNKPWPMLLQLEHELEAARREQAREGGGSDGK